MNPYLPPGAPNVPYAAPPGPTYGAPVSEGVIAMLRQTRPWARFISVLCFIGAAFMLIASLVMIAAGAASSALVPGATASPFPLAAMGMVYVPLSAFYIYPGIKLWKYASAIVSVEASRTAADLENALLQQKSFWKYVGIVTIVMFVLYIVVIFGMIAVGVSKGLGKT